MPDLALDDIRVLDLTHHRCGPYATKLLADYGAAVLRVERPAERLWYLLAARPGRP